MIQKIAHCLFMASRSITQALPALATSALLVTAVDAHAETWRIGVYSGQWANSRLPDLPYNIATGQLTLNESYVHSIIVSRHFLTKDLFIPRTLIGFSDAQIELEGTASLHRGNQNHQEATLGVMLRTPDFELGSFGSINFG